MRKRERSTRQVLVFMTAPSAAGAALPRTGHSYSLNTWRMPTVGDGSLPEGGIPLTRGRSVFIGLSGRCRVVFGIAGNRERHYDFEIDLSNPNDLTLFLRVRVIQVWKREWMTTELIFKHMFHTIV